MDKIDIHLNGCVAMVVWEWLYGMWNYVFVGALQPACSRNDTHRVQNTEVKVVRTSEWSSFWGKGFIDSCVIDSCVLSM